MYREQLEQINSKVYALQAELTKVSDYESKVEQLTRDLAAKESELEMAKKYYKEKLQLKKKQQQDQKKEWTSIYTELLTEIRQLKAEIDSLGYENKKLMSSFKVKPEF